MTATTKRRLTGFCTPSNPRTPAYDPHQNCRGCDCRAEGCPCAGVPGPPAEVDVVEGFFDDVPEAEYHSDPASLSVTGAKTLLRSPQLFRWQQDHPVHKDVFDYGSAAHAKALGVGATVVVVDAEDWRTKAAREERDAARARGEVALLAADHQRVLDMADALSGHTLAMSLLSEGRPEVSAYCRDDGSGVMRRGRFDWLGPQVLTDYKSCISADPRDLAGRYGVVKKWGYDQQAAWYTDLARDLGHPAAAFAFIFQAKEAPYPVTVAYVDDTDLYDARLRNAQALDLFADCTRTGVWPGYLPDDSAALLSLTDQTYTTEKIA